ncbi:hypothetical protein OGAPHI_001405 [Ogataea philodendri]|uniref:Uncharacterized protein n=1 Tax=Ogataea philodendri TaxID=1378263 RepID=A0A9P8PDI3_9ASCO|nr:uncharacterized protein OGAPHI_001405 [Ogataea philodendri]KAH3669284.1 hypothetical protein OGAPHI_001405 [Ogataea philodendri]
MTSFLKDSSAFRSRLAAFKLEQNNRVQPDLSDTTLCNDSSMIEEGDKDNVFVARATKGDDILPDTPAKPQRKRRRVETQTSVEHLLSTISHLNTTVERQDAELQKSEAKLAEANGKLAVYKKLTNSFKDRLKSLESELVIAGKEVVQGKKKCSDLSRTTFEVLKETRELQMKTQETARQLQCQTKRFEWLKSRHQESSLTISRQEIEMTSLRLRLEDSISRLVDEKQKNTELTNLLASKAHPGSTENIEQEVRQIYTIGSKMEQGMLTVARKMSDQLRSIINASTSVPRQLEEIEKTLADVAEGQKQSGDQALLNFKQTKREIEYQSLLDEYNKLSGEHSECEKKHIQDQQEIEALKQMVNSAPKPSATETGTSEQPQEPVKRKRGRKKNPLKVLG